MKLIRSSVTVVWEKKAKTSPVLAKACSCYVSRHLKYRAHFSFSQDTLLMHLSRCISQQLQLSLTGLLMLCFCTQQKLNNVYGFFCRAKVLRPIYNSITFYMVC